MNGTTINGFTLQRLLGVGGMAEVWYAENEIGLPAAVKILSKELSANEQMRDRFLNEAKVMVQLNHPNIRKVLGYGNIDGRPAIIMEYLEGNDLKAMMKQGRRFTAEEYKRWWNQMVDALNYTHAEGIVHRDIKPSNIFIDKKGNVKLLDFGIAKVRESISVTQTGAMMGTLMYMSPEQVDDAKHLGPASDVYSLAVSFVHVITGKTPYDSSNLSDFKIRECIVYKPLDMTDVPTEWQTFLQPYLAKEPNERPALRPFDATVEEVPAVANVKVTPNVVALDDDEGTVVAEADKSKAQPQPAEPKEKPATEADKKPKGKKGLWIGLAVAAVVAIALFVLLKPDPDTEAFKACQTVKDYREYVNHFGSNGKHYPEAKQFVEKHVADSTAKAQELLAKEKAEAERKAKEEAEKKELELAQPKSSISYSGSTMIVSVGNVTFNMIKVEGGTFQMGATSEQGGDAYDDEKPVHSVTVSSFYMGETEVTQALWKAVMGSNPSRWKGDNLPVEQVSWNDCQKFIKKLNDMTGQNFRLPTEAEWEYAARGGKKGNGYKYAGSNDIGSVVWYTDNSGVKTHPVKGKSPNELGLYDMSGNVYEWCSDWYGKEYYSSSPSNNPKGPSSGSIRVLRGGSWYSRAGRCRVSARFNYGPGNRDIINGFRLALPQ